ncbi:MAG TPA: phosphate-starvation-inducible PsiE family protein [Magnetospirillaceae bacterium]|nr:phosphate-starvation-inducible PsiE family protein [Magnetospirillaceae bacterium]
MDSDQDLGKGTNQIIERATNAFLKIEIFAYVVLGLLLALTALLGMVSASTSLWASVARYGDAGSIVVTIDRLLFVLMLVEILHTVRVSFRSGTLVCEPFLIVGLIASIRRILAITLESSQASEPGKWVPDLEAILRSTMLELSVLGGLILVMVISICLLRYSNRFGPVK